jgi:hypothetical protein
MGLGVKTWMAEIAEIAKIVLYDPLGEVVNIVHEDCRRAAWSLVAWYQRLYWWLELFWVQNYSWSGVRGTPRFHLFSFISWTLSVIIYSKIFQYYYFTFHL